MGNLIDHAKKELEIAKLFSGGDFYDGLIGKSVMELIQVFENQNHSGQSAHIVSKIFYDLANYKILTPLQDNDDEWEEVGNNVFQNKRLSSVFKSDGKVHFLEAIVWKDENGVAFTGTVENITSSQYIKFPFVPKTFFVKIKNDKIVDKEELKKALEYYSQNQS